MFPQQNLTSSKKSCPIARLLSVFLPQNPQLLCVLICVQILNILAAQLKGLKPSPQQSSTTTLREVAITTTQLLLIIMLSHGVGKSSCLTAQQFHPPDCPGYLHKAKYLQVLIYKIYLALT